VTTREPEFDAEQLALLRAYMDLTGDRGSHGLPLSETTHPDANPAVRGGWHYEANESPRIDYAGQAIGKAQDAYYKAHPDERAFAEYAGSGCVDDRPSVAGVAVQLVSDCVRNIGAA
jgi:hypothetical protein